MASLIYPVISSWVWGGGWLQQLGFHDHGGAGVVHLTSGLAGMVGTYILGPRLGMFNTKTPQKGSFEFTRIAYKNQQHELSKLENKIEEMKEEYK